jgi:hypothetical protein
VIALITAGLQHAQRSRKKRSRTRDLQGLPPSWTGKLLAFQRDPAAGLDYFELNLHDNEELDALDQEPLALLPDNEEYVNLWFWHAVLLGALAVPDPDIYRAKDNAVPMDLFPEEPLISCRLNVAMSRCEPMRPMTSQT